MQESLGKQLRKSRRIVIAAVAMTCIGAYIAWQVTHRRDARLVGDWIVTSEPPSGWTEQWRFDGDGTGYRSWRREDTENRYTVTSFSEGFCWRTNGDHLALKWGTNSPRFPWESFLELVREFDHALSGRAEPYPVHRYSFNVDGDQFVGVEPVGEPTNPGYEVMTFTRTGGD